MKKVKLMFAAVIMMGAVCAKAQGIMVGYDSRIGTGYGLTSSFRDAVADRTVPVPVKSKAAALAPAEGVSTVTIDIRLIEENTVKKETLICAKGDAGAAVKNCRKISDGSLLTAEEVRSFRVAPFFQPQGLSFRGQLRKAEQENKAGCYDIREECVAWKVVREKVCDDWVEVRPGVERCASWVMEETEVCTRYVKYCND